MNSSNMEISQTTIKQLAKIIVLDEQYKGKTVSYKSRSELVEFFKELGENDVYGQEFPGRFNYAKEKIEKLNGTPKLAELFKLFLRKNQFDEKYPIEKVVETINQSLQYDEYKIVEVDGFYQVQALKTNQLITNQGVGAEYEWKYLKFRSKTEIKIAEALDRAGVLFLPNCRARLTTPEGRQNKEADFLICDDGKWGILEVDGPHHTPERRVEEQERERMFRHYGIMIIERFDSNRCYEKPDAVVEEFLELLKKSK